MGATKHTGKPVVKSAQIVKDKKKKEIIVEEPKKKSLP